MCEHRDTKLDRTFTGTAQEAMRVAVVISAFLRSAARAKILRLLLGQPAVEESLARQGARLMPLGCSALTFVSVRQSDLGVGGLDLIKCVWRATRQPLRKHSDLRIARALPEAFPLDLEECDKFEGTKALHEDFRKAFLLAGKFRNKWLDARQYGTALSKALSDPIIQTLTQREARPEQLEEFAAFMSQADRHARFPFRPELAFDADESSLNCTGGSALRAAAFNLLTAARVLACQVRASQAQRNASGGVNRVHWLALPVEIRRACLEDIPTLFVPTTAELNQVFSIEQPEQSYMQSIQRQSILSSRTINRIFAYAADRRTIGYGCLPEATFLDLRIASDAAYRTTTQSSMRVLDESRWSFAAASRRWRPLDSRPEPEAKYMDKTSGLCWPAECFLRAIGIVEDLIELIPPESS